MLPRPTPSWKVFATALVIGVVATRAGASVEPPLPLPGPYPVACSNVAQDFSRVKAGEDVQAYWSGLPRDTGSQRFVTDLLSEAANALAVFVNVPNDAGLYGSYAARTFPFVVLACYPTSAANARPNYPLPTGPSIPHMQRGSEPPLFPDATSRFPLLLMSHGYGGSPLANDYLQALMVFASYGYVVAAPFHGDWQYNVKLESFADIAYFTTHAADIVAMQALRPLAMSATINLLLSNLQWRDRIDAAKIGAFGASLGGESVMLLAGAGLTTSIGQSWTAITRDVRVKAGVGYVPYFGQPGLPAFGRDQHGIETVTMPFLGIGGTSDITAPISITLQGMSRLPGTRELVSLIGVKHGFDVASTNDIYTWSLTFLDSEVRGDPAADDRLHRMTAVAGGGDDRVILALDVPPSNNFGGLWWNSPAGSEAGWGINVAHQGDVMFVTWLTYDLYGKAWWLSMTANKGDGDSYSGILYETRGPPFNSVPFDPTRVTTTAVGFGQLIFNDARTGAFSYTVNGITQAKSIALQTFAEPVPSCAFGPTTDPILATNYQDIWWNAPAESEAGWGLNLTHQGDVIFAVWFTYELDGTPFWRSATLNKTNGKTYSGTLYQTRGPAWNAVPFDPQDVVQTPVGTASVTFADGNTGSFSYNVNGIAQTKVITREILRAPGTVCQ